MGRLSFPWELQSHGGREAASLEEPCLQFSPFHCCRPLATALSQRADSRGPAASFGPEGKGERRCVFQNPAQALGAG